MQNLYDNCSTILVTFPNAFVCLSVLVSLNCDVPASLLPVTVVKMSSKRKNSRPTKIADIYEAPELFETFEGNELCGNYSTNDAYVQIQRFLDHDSEGKIGKIIHS